MSAPALLGGWNVRPVQEQRTNGDLRTRKYEAAGPSVGKILWGVASRPVTFFAGLSMAKSWGTDSMQCEQIKGLWTMFDCHDKVDTYGRMMESAGKTAGALKGLFRSIGTGKGVVVAFTEVTLHSLKTVKSFVKVTRHTIAQGVFTATEATKSALKTSSPIFRCVVGGVEIFYEIIAPVDEKLRNISALGWQKFVAVSASTSAIAWGLFQINEIFVIVAVAPIVAPICLTAFLAGIFAKQIAPPVIARLGSQWQADKLNTEYRLTS